MNNSLKKHLGIAMIALGMVAFSIPQFTAYAKAADVDNELEDDNTKFTANSLTSNKTMIGFISSEDDVDYYKYVVDQSGYFSIKFENASGTGDVSNGWTWKIYDKDLNKLWSDTTKSTSASYNYNFEVGTVLYVTVESAYQHKYVNNLDYALTVTAVEDSSWEQEQNGTKNTATTITSNQKAFGNTYIETDVDYYKYVVDATGYFNFILQNETGTNDSSYGWDMLIYDSSLNKLEYVKNITAKSTSKTYNFKKGTVLYIKIEAYSNYYHINGTKYSLLAQMTKSSKWEQEGNDSYTKATTIKNNSTMYGNIYIANDKDCYKYKASKTGNVKVTFDFDGDDAGYGWNITVINSSKKELISLTDVTTKKSFSWKATKGSNYYIIITPRYSYSDPLNLTYSMKVKQ